MSDITLNTQSITGNHNFVPPGTDWNLGSGSKKWNGGYFGTIIADNGIPAGTAATGGDKIGQIRFSINPNIEPGYLALNGQEVNRDDYPNLWEWVQQQVGFLVEEGEWQSISTAHNGNVGKYSVGNGSTTFRLPNLGCWVRGGGTAGTANGVGGNLDAGLPNITGTLTSNPTSGVTDRTDLGVGAGAFASTTQSYGYYNAGSKQYTGSGRASFDASDSNPIYGNAETVQPESIVGIWLVKAYHVPVDNMGNTITVNGVPPDENGNIAIEAPQVRGLPVGFEYFTFNSNVAVGSLPYLGSLYSRSAYADLWSWVQEQPGYLISETEWQEKFQANNGNVPFYSSGDGSTTFRVPSLKCWVKGANETGEIGEYLPAGSPEIEGVSNGGMSNDAYSRSTGAFNCSDDKNTEGLKLGLFASTTTSKTATINTFKASRSSSVYGNADTVQPESIVGIWCVKAFGTVSNGGNQDVAELSAEVTRVGTQVNEVADSVKGMIDYVVESSYTENGWYRKYKSGFVIQSGAVSLSISEDKTVSLLVAMENANYIPILQSTNGSDSDVNNALGADQITSTSFRIYSSDYACTARWIVFGQGA